VCSLTYPFPILSINPSWWALNGLASPPEAEYKDKALRSILQRSNHFSANIVEHLLALLPRVAGGIPNRVPFISALNGHKIFFYLRVVPLVNENLEVSSALLTLSDAPLSPQVSTSIQDHTIISDPIISANAALHASPSLPQSGWDMLRNTPFVPPNDQSMCQLSFQGSPIDPVWGGALPYPHSQVLDAPLRSQFPRSFSPRSVGSSRANSQGGNHPSHPLQSYPV
jgi:hypothetical protein